MVWVENPLSKKIPNLFIIFLCFKAWYQFSTFLVEVGFCLAAYRGVTEPSIRQARLDLVLKE